MAAIFYDVIRKATIFAELTIVVGQELTKIEGFEKNVFAAPEQGNHQIDQPNAVSAYF